MTERPIVNRSLTRAGLVARLSISGAVALALFGLRVVDPAGVSWFPLRMSCGAFTGLPCIFCGTTRAMHHLLQGQFSRALYFNWLAFPLLLIAVTVVVVFAAEIVTQRRHVTASFSVKFTPKTIAWASAGLAALWILQVSLAVSMHKHELLNPAGPLYAPFVK